MYIFRLPTQVQLNATRDIARRYAVAKYNEGRVKDRIETINTMSVEDCAEELTICLDALDHVRNAHPMMSLSCNPLNECQYVRFFFENASGVSKFKH